MTECTAPAAEESLLIELRQDGPPSFGAMFLARAGRTPAEVAYRRPPEAGGGAWVPQTWAENQISRGMS